MKKLFVSLPMKGREKEKILDSMEMMKQIAEIIFHESMEILPSFIEEEPPEDVADPSIWYLGKSLEQLAKADRFIGILDTYYWPGCKIEKMAAQLYGIPSYFVDHLETFMPDSIFAAELEQEAEARKIAEVRRYDGID